MGVAFNQIKRSWNKTSKKGKLFYSYTLLFLVVFFAAYSPFLLNAKSLVCNFDGRETNLQGLIHMGQWVRNSIQNMLHGDFNIPVYNLSYGWGGGSLPLASDPLEVLLAPLFPMKYVEVLYAILILVRLYLAGLAFLHMCLFFERGASYSLIGCFVYLFSGYTTYAGLAFPSYLNPMIQLPLLIVGAEKVMRRQRSIGFIFTVMYTALCGYYHLYIQTILVGIYCVVRLFVLYPKGKWIKTLLVVLLHGIGLYILGLGLASWSQLPAMLGFTSARRSTFHNLNISVDFIVHWKSFWTRLMTLISPIAEYDWDWGLDYPAFAAIFLLAVVVLFAGKRKAKTTQKWLVFIGLFMLFCPWCGWVLNGFQYACNRWSFGLALIAGFLVVDMLPEILHMEKRQRLAAGLVLCAYGCIAMLSALIRRAVFAAVGTAFFAATLLHATWSFENHRVKRERLQRCICLALVCLNVCVNNLYLCSPESMGWINWFAKANQETRRLSVAMESEPKYAPYGYDITKGRVDSTKFYYIDSIVYDQPGTLMYSPLISGAIVDFWLETEGSGNIQYFKIYSSDQRTMLNTLLSVNQQFEMEDSLQYIPFGYSYCGSTYLGSQVYQNDYALPWGYTYDHSISYDELAGLNGIDKQEAMLQAVVLDVDKQLRHTAIDTKNERIPYTFECSNCNWENGVVQVGANGGKIQLKADLPAGKEYYVRIRGFNIDSIGENVLTISTNASFNIGVQCGDVFKYGRAMARAYPWYYGREDYLFCLGYKDEDRDSVALQIPYPGIFPLEDIELFALPLDQYPEQVEKLRAEPLENVDISANRIAGTVDLSEDKVLCLTVPYEKGWSAFVDGQQMDIMRANYAFMGLSLNAGHHDIEFRYHLPYLKEGLLLSGISLGLTLIVIVLTKKKRRE